MNQFFVLRNIYNIYFYSLHSKNWKLNLTAEMELRETFWKIMK